MFTATVATPAVAPLARAASASNARGANGTATAPPRILRAAAALKSSSSAENRGASLATRGTRREMEELAGLGGDFGARDATAGELESNFNAKSIGEADTEHMLQIPRKVEEFTALHLRACVAVEAGEPPIEETQKLVYQKQVADWKIRIVDAHEVLRREFATGGDKAKAAEVVTRLEAVAEEEAQTIASFVEGPGVRIELHTAAVNGLHANDFVLAAKLDKVDLGDVTVKKKPNVFLV